MIHHVGGYKILVPGHAQQPEGRDPGALAAPVGHALAGARAAHPGARADSPRCREHLGQQRVGGLLPGQLGVFPVSARVGLPAGVGQEHGPHAPVDRRGLGRAVWRLSGPHRLGRHVRARTSAGVSQC